MNMTKKENLFDGGAPVDEVPVERAPKTALRNEAYVTADDMSGTWLLCLRIDLRLIHGRVRLEWELAENRIILSIQQQREDELST
jgi:hypothetical protein